MLSFWKDIGIKMKNQYVHGSAARKRNSEKRFEVVSPSQKQKPVSVQWTPLYVIMLSAMGLLFMVMIMNNIKLSSEVTSLRNTKGKLTDQYEDLVLSNNLYYDSIVSKVDLAEIERVAVVELGMSMAKKGQIVEYSGEMEDYVKQYQDIPR